MKRALLALCLLACGDDPTPAPAAAAGTAGAAGTASTAGAAGSAGGQPWAEALAAFPELDPAGCVPSALPAQVPAYKPLESGSTEQDKAFYLVTVLEADDARKARLAALPLAQARRAAAAEAAQCAGDLACARGKLVPSQADLDGALDEAMAALGAEADALVGDHLRASRRFALHEGLSDAELWRAAWGDAAAWITGAFDAHAAGLDAAALGPVIEAAAAGEGCFFRPLLSAALGAMKAQKRDEAARYEPLASGENAATLAALGQIDFSRYPFAFVLVPGQGPGNDQPLSPGSKLRSDLAAARFKVGVAPLLLLSGGHVHPDRTPFSEAIEMKKYLIDAHQIPPDRLLVDPHARHTTTNLRNASRYAFLYGLPTSKPALVTSDIIQTAYISAEVDNRSLDELGYVPWSFLSQRSKNDSCFFATPTALYLDGSDPLDP